MTANVDFCWLAIPTYMRPSSVSFAVSNNYLFSVNQCNFGIGKITKQMSENFKVYVTLETIYIILQTIKPFLKIKD